MLTIRRLWFPTATLLAASSVSVVAAYAAPQTATPQTAKLPIVATRVYDKASVFRKEDARLEKKISVDRPQVYAGELLEMFAEQTGVSIEASDSDGAASEELVAVLKDMPLADAMECLTSLLSHKNARWQWRREGNGKEKPYVYRLLRPENAIAAYAEQAKAQIQADFEDESDTLIAGLDMSPEELKRKAKDNPCLDYLINGKTTPRGIRAFRDSLTPEQRTNLLRGNNPRGITMPVKDLPPSVQALATYMRDQFQQGNAGSVPDGQTATFAITNIDYPGLVVGFSGLGGWTCAGGNMIQDDLTKREMGSWLQDGETKTDKDIEAQTLPKPKNRKRTESVPGNNQMPGRFSYMGEAGTFSVLARLERDPTRGSAEEPWQNPVGTFLQGHEKPYNLLRKWHKNGDGKPVLLVDYMGWYQQDTDPKHPRLPWQAVKRFRQIQAGGTNEQLMDTVLYASAVLREEEQQIRMASSGYPLAPWMFTNHRWLQPLAQFAMAKPDRYKQLISPQGIPFKVMPDEVRIALLSARTTPDDKKMAIVSGSARLVLIPDGTGEDSFRLEVLDEQGNLLSTVSAPNWKSEALLQ